MHHLATLSWARVTCPGRASSSSRRSPSSSRASGVRARGDLRTLGSSRGARRSLRRSGILIEKGLALAAELGVGDVIALRGGATLRGYQGDPAALDDCREARDIGLRLGLGRRHGGGDEQPRRRDGVLSGCARGAGAVGRGNRVLARPRPHATRRCGNAASGFAPSTTSGLGRARTRKPTRSCAGTGHGGGSSRCSGTSTSRRCSSIAGRSQTHGPRRCAHAARA